MTDATRFDRLTKRHRDCLRGVRALKGSKEIAAELGIEKSTVDSYLTEATRILGAANRRDAALQLARHEDAEAVPEPQETAVSLPPEAAPDKMGGDSARLSGPGADLPIRPQPDDSIVGLPGAVGERSAGTVSPAIRWPVRREGRKGNNLSVGDRLIWIQAITLGIAIGFGMLMTGLQVLTGLIETVSNTLS